MGRKKLNNIQEAEMEKIVYYMMMKGYSNYRIIDELLENHGFNSEGNCRRIIDKVNKSLREKSEKDLDIVKEKYLEMYTDLYNKCVADGDHRGANEVLKSLTKLRGLDIQKIEIKDTTFEIEF